MGLFDFLRDMRQDTRIRAAENAAARSTRRVQDGHQELLELRAALDRLALQHQALWELLRDRAELTDDDLRAKLDELDLRDGRADGRMGPAAVPCPKCAKANANSRQHCLYCGAALQARGTR